MQHKLRLPARAHGWAAINLPAYDKSQVDSGFEAPALPRVVVLCYEPTCPWPPVLSGGPGFQALRFRLL